MGVSAIWRQVLWPNAWCDGILSNETLIERCKSYSIMWWIMNQWDSNWNEQAMNFWSWPHIAAPPAVGRVWTILAGKRSSAPRRVHKTFDRAGQGLSNGVNVDWIPVTISELWILKDPQLEAWNERHLPSPAFGGPWRADASSDRNGLNRLSIEDFTGYRMVLNLMKFN